MIHPALLDRFEPYREFIENHGRLLGSEAAGIELDSIHWNHARPSLNYLLSHLAEIPKEDRDFFRNQFLRLEPGDLLNAPHDPLRNAEPEGLIARMKHRHRVLKALNSCDPTGVRAIDVALEKLLKLGSIFKQLKRRALPEIQIFRQEIAALLSRDHASLAKWQVWLDATLQERMIDFPTNLPVLYCDRIASPFSEDELYQVRHIFAVSRPKSAKNYPKILFRQERWTYDPNDHSYDCLSFKFAGCRFNGRREDVRYESCYHDPHDVDESSHSFFAAFNWDQADTSIVQTTLRAPGKPTGLEFFSNFLSNEAVNRLRTHFDPSWEDLKLNDSRSHRFRDVDSLIDPFPKNLDVLFERLRG